MPMKNGIAKVHQSDAVKDLRHWKGTSHALHVKDGVRGVAEKGGKVRYGDAGSIHNRTH